MNDVVVRASGGRAAHLGQTERRTDSPSARRCCHNRAHIPPLPQPNIRQEG